MGRINNSKKGTKIMKKPYLLLILSAATLVGCTNSGESSSEEAVSSSISSVISSSSESSSSEPTLEGIVLSQGTCTLNITKDVANPTVTLTVTCNPASFASETVTWTSSDTSVATVTNGVVTGIAKGSATITATVLDKSATCVVTVEKSIFDNVIDTTVVNAVTSASNSEKLNQALYRISGVVENLSSSNEFRIVDVGGTGKYVTARFVGSSSTKDTDFTVDDTTGVITYSRDAGDVFDSLGITEGKYVTIVGVYASDDYGFWYYNGYLESITDGTEQKYTASVTVDDESHGSATLSKMENITWGEEIEVTTTPASGYSVATVTCNDLTVSQDEDGKYVFNARAVNVVKVTFAEETSKTITINFSSTFDTDDSKRPYSNQFVTTDGTSGNKPTLSTSNGYLALSRSTKDDQGNSLDTIADFNGKIDKIDLTAYSNKSVKGGTHFKIYGTNDAYDVTGATARTWTQIGDEQTITASSATLNEFSITGSYKFIRVQNTETTVIGAQLRITSIVYYVK